VRMLCHDGQGFWLLQKRLSEGHFRWWPKGTGHPTDPLAVHELQLLLWNGDPKAGRVAPPWRRLATG
jgi:hypothetical protein